jgi:acyl-CoA synthetase (AMP-forming)/AMP-acid ligase II
VIALRNIAHHLRAMAEEKPYQRAVVCPQGRDRSGRVRYAHLTYQQLERSSDSIAAGLRRIGVGRGTRVALLVPPSLDFFSLAFALAKVGATLVLVDPGIGARRVGRCLAEAEPEVFAGVPVAHLASVALGWSKGTIRTRITVGRRFGWGGYTLDDLRDPIDAPFPMAEPGPNETAGIFFTSGSTGAPKGVVYTHDIFAAQIEFLREHFQVAGNEIDLPTFPPFALFDPALGLTAVLPDMDASRPAKADPAKLVEAIRDHGVTQMFGSPAVIDLLSRHAVRTKSELPSLRRVLSAGAPVRGDILERMSLLLHRDARFYTPYGATEALPVTSIESREILAETRRETARGGGVCVGTPIRQVKLRMIRITDDPIETWTDDLLVADGEVGEIVVQGAIVTQAYHARPEANAMAKIRDSNGGGLMHRMGDVGRLDARGRLWFYGRKAHRVETAAGTLFPVACEGIVNEHAEVFRSALVGVGAMGAQEPVLVLELEQGVGRAAEARVRNEILETCARHDPLAGVRRVLFHPGFPVDRRHNAKIDRPALARWAAGREQ